MVAEPGGLDLLHYLPHGRICYLALTTQRPGLIRDLGYTLSVGRLIRSLFGYHLVFPLSLMEAKPKDLAYADLLPDPSLSLRMTQKVGQWQDSYPTGTPRLRWGHKQPAGASG